MAEEEIPEAGPEKGVCEVCQRVGKMHECVKCGSDVCLSCVGRDGCKNCKTNPKK